MLERLTALAQKGALTIEEFAAEKALILGHSADQVRSHPARPSLVGRLFGWRLIPVGLILGVGLSFAAQPDATIRFFEQAVRALD